MKSIIRLIWVVFIVNILPIQAFATGMPVIDIASVTQLILLINKAKNQIDQLKNLSAVNNKQFGFLQKNLQGNYGYGGLLNDNNALNQRQWSNDSWVDVLNESNNGHVSAFTAAQKKYDQLYPVVNPDKIVSTRSQNNLARTYYQQSSEISRAALAASSYSYDKLNEHIKNLHDMLAKLDSQTSEKAAIDINARLVAELGFIQLELLRQQTMQNQLIATQTQGEVNGMSDQAKFMQWHP